jgi:hypothetical protein
MPPQGVDGAQPPVQPGRVAPPPVRSSTKTTSSWVSEAVKSRSCKRRAARAITPPIIGTAARAITPPSGEVPLPATSSNRLGEPLLESRSWIKRCWASRRSPRPRRPARARAPAGRHERHPEPARTGVVVHGVPPSAAKPSPLAAQGCLGCRDQPLRLSANSAGRESRRRFVRRSGDPQASSPSHLAFQRILVCSSVIPTGRSTGSSLAGGRLEQRQQETVEDGLLGVVQVLEHVSFDCVAVPP